MRFKTRHAAKDGVIDWLQAGIFLHQSSDSLLRLGQFSLQNAELLRQVISYCRDTFTGWLIQGAPSLLQAWQYDNDLAEEAAEMAECSSC